MQITDRLFFIDHITSMSTANGFEKKHLHPMNTTALIINPGDCLQLTAGGRTILLARNEVYMLSSQIQYTVTQKQLDFIYLSIEPDFLQFYDCDKLFSFALSEKQADSVFQMDEEQIACICNLSDKMFREYQANSRFYMSFRYSWLSEILTTLFIPMTSKDSPASVAGKVLHFLEAHYQEKFSIDQLAEQFYISKYHLMRQFKKETGYTIHNYILNKRILYACRLISDGRSPRDSCFSSGFTDYSLFFKCFTKIMGFSPSQFQTSIQTKQTQTG